MKKLYGVTVAMITPFTEEGNVDVKALEKKMQFAHLMEK